MSSNKPVIISIAAMLVFLPINEAFAFGVTGHRIVAQIAQDNLSATAIKVIMKITKGESLVELATWPDEIRSDSRWDHAKPWHYLSIEDDEFFKDFARSKDGDVLKALSYFETKLRDSNITGQEKWQALAFYVHFVGDIHQPLHVGRRDDRGGNNIKVKWFGEYTNLHAVWDSSIIKHQQLSFSEYAEFLNHVSEGSVKAWQQAAYLDWAKGSKAIRQTVYDFAQDANLSYDYAYKNTPILNEQITKAGIRLAGMLNEIFNTE